jgi:hypothetical protein
VAEASRPLLSARDDVLEALGLVVDFVPPVAQGLGEVGLEQPVVAQHFERHLPARLSQADAAVAAVVDQSELGEPLHHARHRRRPDPEPDRKGLGADAAAAPAEQKDLLEVVLLGRRQGKARAPAAHQFLG